MRRTLITLVALLLVVGTMPSAGRAQGAAEGPGVAADHTTTASATAFVKTFVKRFNHADSSTFDLAIPSYWGGATRDEVASSLTRAASITLYAIGPVEMYAATGHVSIELSYSGRWTPSSYWTERWWLEVAGKGFRLDRDEELTPTAAGKLKAGNAKLTLAKKGLSINTTTFSGVTLLVLALKNAEKSQALTTGVYELPEGVTVKQAQATLGRGDFSAYRYLGPTPLHPAERRAFAFLVEPGKRYLVQEWSLDANFNPTILSGSSYAAIVTIASGNATPPAA